MQFTLFTILALHGFPFLLWALTRKKPFSTVRLVMVLGQILASVVFLVLYPISAMADYWTDFSSSSLTLSNLFGMWRGESLWNLLFLLSAALVMGFSSSSENGLIHHDPGTPPAHPRRGRPSYPLFITNWQQFAICHCYFCSFRVSFQWKPPPPRLPERRFPMQIARRICLPWWSFLLICAAAMAITALVVYEATTEPEPEAPVSYSFQPETGALTFYIPEGWELLRVFTRRGCPDHPPYHQDTRSLTIDLTELPETGGRDLIHIQCLPPEEGLLPFSFFEVLRQSTGGEFILFSSPDQLNWTWESVFYQPTT